MGTSDTSKKNLRPEKLETVGDLPGIRGALRSILTETGVSITILFSK